MISIIDELPTVYRLYIHFSIPMCRAQASAPITFYGKCSCALQLKLPYLYLGYWIKESRKNGVQSRIQATARFDRRAVGAAERLQRFLKTETMLVRNGSDTSGLSRIIVISYRCAALIAAARLASGSALSAMANFPIELRQVFKARCYIGMIPTQCFFRNSQRCLKSGSAYGYLP